MRPKDVKLKEEKWREKNEESGEEQEVKNGGCAKDRLTTEAREIRP